MQKPNFDRKLTDEERTILIRLQEEHWRENGYRALKLSLLQQFGVCFWCDRKVSDYNRTKGYQPPDTATVDHLVSKYFREPGDVSLKVLSCLECNQERAHNEHKLFHAKN